MQKNVGTYHKSNWEIYSPIKNFIFKVSKIYSSEIIKILFQSKSDSVFHKLIDSDEDYELSITLETVLLMTQMNIQKR